MDLNRNLCPDCLETKTYHSKHDTFYCEHCDQWLEGICQEGTCHFCQDRPERPSQVE